MNGRRTLSAFAFLSLGALAMTRTASAQFVVVDPTALTQLLVQVQQLTQEITLAQRTLAQAQQAYNSMTGNRGMQNLISGVNRNYLPATWDELNSAMGGGGGTYAALGGDVNVTVTRNAILTGTQTAGFSTNELDSLNQRRRSVALLESLSRSALGNSSGRFASLQSLISAIPTATDQKGALDLHARITAEHTMLQNENSKLNTLYQAAQVASQTEQLRSDEKAIADIGHLSQLPPMGLGTGSK
jgi:type IV secretion system protein VirB5